MQVEPVQETWGEGGGLRSVMVKVRTIPNQTKQSTYVMYVASIM